jgi:hypothetical protein
VEARAPRCLARTRSASQRAETETLASAQRRALDCIGLLGTCAAETRAVLSGTRVHAGRALRRTCLADVADVAGDVSPIGMSVSGTIERNRARTRRHRGESDRLGPFEQIARIVIARPRSARAPARARHANGNEGIGDTAD